MVEPIRVTFGIASTIPPSLTGKVPPKERYSTTAALSPAILATKSNTKESRSEGKDNKRNRNHNKAQTFAAEHPGQPTLPPISTNLLPPQPGNQSMAQSRWSDKTAETQSKQTENRNNGASG